MKITKYPQSCLLIETREKKILIDPGEIEYKEKYLEQWKKVDAILITHKHPDHCYVDIIEKLEKPIYSTQEVQNTYPNLKMQLVKQGDTFSIGDVQIEVVHAEHGYIPPMKQGGKVIENVGYILDDSENRLYHTSDTICFENNYQCDILCAPVSDYGVTMGAFEVALMAKDVNASLVIPIHLEAPKYPINYIFLKDTFEKNNVEYEILENEETIEIN